jgi:hypothetical protein
MVLAEKQSFAIINHWVGRKFNGLTYFNNCNREYGNMLLYTLRCTQGETTYGKKFTPLGQR